MHILVRLMQQHRNYMAEECNSSAGQPMKTYLSYQFGCANALHTIRLVYPGLTQDDIIEMEGLLNECDFLRYRYRRT